MSVLRPDYMPYCWRSTALETGPSDAATEQLLQ